MQSSRSTSSMVERVIRMMSAELRYPTASAGSRNWARLARRSSNGETCHRRIQPIERTSRRITIIASQNDGMDRPASDTTRSA